MFLNEMTEAIQTKLLPFIETSIPNPRERELAVENVQRALAAYNTAVGHSAAEQYVAALEAQGAAMMRKK